MIDDISSSGDKRGTEHVALDLERLETTLSLVKKDVQTIETSREWENTGSLLKAAEKLEASLEGLFKLLEKGTFQKTYHRLLHDSIAVKVINVYDMFSDLSLAIICLSCLDQSISVFLFYQQN